MDWKFALSCIQCCMDWKFALYVHNGLKKILGNLLLPCFITSKMKSMKKQLLHMTASTSHELMVLTHIPLTVLKDF